MASIDDGDLYLEITNADEAQLRCGLAAARMSLTAAGVNVDEAFAARCKWEVDVEADQWSLTDEDERLGNAWWDAQKAALEGSGSDWRDSNRAHLVPWRFEQESRVETERTLAAMPQSKLIPPLDPGPHFKAKPAALLGG